MDLLKKKNILCIMPIVSQITDLDFVLFLIIGYGLGVVSGLCYCMKYRNAFLTRSKSLDSFKDALQAGPPSINSTPIMASAPMPPAHNPVKLTIE
jgi:hypothetical protein